MRDHNNEYQDNTRRYAYEFDYVIQGYLMRSLAPYFPKHGKALELGCFEGEGTKRFVQHFDDLSVLEAASSLIETARKKVPATVKFINSTIETAELEPVYDAIFLIHTLEHLDDGIGALKRIGQWLSPGGRLFVAVPNGDAASRQIAAKMGIVNTNNSVTAAELAHGHRCTYSFDTLEYDIRQAGLSILARGGVFFKPFANFQFDQLLKTSIIDQAYLDGCYALGMQYPELCSSIYMVCER